MLVVSKTYKFDSAHLIPNHPSCGVVHGHTYTLEVSLVLKKKNIFNHLLEKKEDKGFLIDFRKLDSVVKTVIAKIDHSFLNDNSLIKKYFKSEVLPSCELLSILLCEEIEKELKKTYNVEFNLITVSIQEGQGGKAIWTK